MTPFDIWWMDLLLIVGSGFLVVLVLGGPAWIAVDKIRDRRQSRRERVLRERQERSA